MRCCRHGCEELPSTSSPGALSISVTPSPISSASKGWAAGGPINEDEVSYDWQKRNLKAALDKEPIEAIEENVIKTLKML